MANVFIERDSDGKYAVKSDGRTVHTAPTQREAEEWQSKHIPGVKPDIERVRQTEGGGPDKWRSK